MKALFYQLSKCFCVNVRVFVVFYNYFPMLCTSAESRDHSAQMVDISLTETLLKYLQKLNSLLCVTKSYMLQQRERISYAII